MTGGEQALYQGGRAALCGLPASPSPVPLLSRRAGGGGGRQPFPRLAGLGAAQGALLGVGATVYVQQYREERAHTIASVITDGGDKFGVSTQPDCFMVTPGAEDLIRWQPNDMAPTVAWGHAEIRGEHIAMFPIQSRPEFRKTCDMLVIGYRSIRYEGRTA